MLPRRSRRLVPSESTSNGDIQKEGLCFPAYPLAGGEHEARVRPGSELLLLIAPAAVGKLISASRLLLERLVGLPFKLIGLRAEKALWKDSSRLETDSKRMAS